MTKKFFISTSPYPTPTVSSGDNAISRLVFCINTIANDKLPIRPQNIMKINTPCEIGSKLRVIPVLMPTVLIADTHSSSTSRKSNSGCTAQITNNPVSNNAK